MQYFRCLRQAWSRPSGTSEQAHEREDENLYDAQDLHPAPMVSMQFDDGNSASAGKQAIDEESKGLDHAVEPCATSADSEATAAALLMGSEKAAETWSPSRRRIESELRRKISRRWKRHWLWKRRPDGRSANHSIPNWRCPGCIILSRTRKGRKAVNMRWRQPCRRTQHWRRLWQRSGKRRQHWRANQVLLSSCEKRR